MKKFDYLIVGQGIAGTVLATELIKEGYKVMIFNEEGKNHSSEVAAGLYNPVTGRKMVKTWLADELFELVGPYYDELEEFFKCKFHYEVPIYRPFVSVEEQNDWVGTSKMEQFTSFVRHCHLQSIGVPNVVDPYGGLELKKTGYLVIPTLLKHARDFFRSKGIYLNELFDSQKVVLNVDGVSYKDYFASKVIFCEGTLSDNNLYFADLKWRPVRGEIMDIEVEQSPEMIINRGVFMMPREGYVKVGATYDNNNLDLNVTEKGIQQLKEKLKKIYSGEFQIIRKYVGLRPATFDRRPYIGFSAENEHIAIFNGFGTKGVSLVPFFAKLFVQNLKSGLQMPAEVRIDR